ncbi:MAG TPA: hypothetical protein VM573_01810 [Actinomycetota bacterium]|jgi:hypothetical protein|nr:hypothetical protein [Actinomycetota bacterium]
MPDVLQCPECNLKFMTKSELEMHLALDHPRRAEEGESDSRS